MVTLKEAAARSGLAGSGEELAALRPDLVSLEGGRPVVELGALAGAPALAVFSITVIERGEL